MKKIAFFLILTLVAASSYAFDFGIGLKGNLGAGTFLGAPYFGDSAKADPKLVTGIGLYFEFGITPKFAIQPEAQITFGNGLNSKMKAAGAATIYDKYNFTSVDGNLFFKGRLPLDKKQTIKIYIMGGPSVAYGLGRVAHTTNATGKDGASSTTDKVAFADADLQKLQVGVALEVGGEFKLGPGVLITGLRTKWNVLNAWTADAQNGGKSFIAHPFLVTVGYGFSF